MWVETLGRTTTVQVGEPVITRAQLSGASSGQESLKVTSGAKPESHNVAVIRLRFTKEGAKALHDLSAAAQGGLLAVLVDGQIIAMPKISEPLTTAEWTISGNFTADNVKALVAKINAGK
jgi:preprotein translocase subunit SecD